MWQPQLLEDPNGAVSVSCVFLCALEASDVARKLAPMLGVDPRPVRDGEYDLRLTSSQVKIVTPAVWNEWSPETALPPLPAPVGLAVGVRSIAETRSYFTQRGIAFRDGLESGIWIDPKDACNTVIYFFGAQN